MKIITFLSDFGDKDWFVAAVKGEILKINKDVYIVDVSHNLDSFDIRAAAFLLKSVYENFPKGTIHLAVVDPGVGGKRRPIIVASKKYLFVGPDNGIFSYVYDQNSQVYEIKTKSVLSPTFHARDIFGPTAAMLAKGIALAKLGRGVKDFLAFAFPKIEWKNSKYYGEIVYIDHFGNLITNISNEVEIKNIYIAKTKIALKRFYGEGRPGELIALKGSTGYYEIACNQGSAQEILDVDNGTIVNFDEQ